MANAEDHANNFLVVRLALHGDEYDELPIFYEAADEIKRLRAERDEARREVCGLLVACHTDPDDEKPDPNLKHIHAGIRGWDCFKENTDV
jgi:hypothetical protein